MKKILGSIMLVALYFATPPAPEMSTLQWVLYAFLIVSIGALTLWDS